MTELKTKQTNANAREFIDSIPDEAQRKDSQVICDIMQEATGATPKMWGSAIVGFGNRHLKYASGRELDWMEIGFSPRKGKMTLYIMTGFDDYAETSGYDPKPLLDKLGKHTTSKGCLYIKKLEDVDLSVLRKLVKQSVDHLRKN